MVSRIILGESGGPTPVIDWQVAGALDAAQRAGVEVYGMFNGLEGLLNASIEGNIVDISQVDPMSFGFNGPGAGLGTTRIKPNDEQYEKMVENLEELGIEGIVYFGGNDSAAQLAGLGARGNVATIHGIKTVDNDLPVTHHCPGYGSASLFNATALKNVHSDYSSYKVKANFEVDGEVREGFDVAPLAIYQVMGRKAGWLAQATAFARVDPKGDMVEDRPPHIVLCKEVPFDQREFLDKLEDVISRLGEAVVVVQEDLTDKETGQDLAKLHAEEVQVDQHGNIQHGRATSFSTCIYLAQLVKAELKVESVYGSVKEVALVPQHIQRSCMISHVDASEAYRVGFAAVQAMLDGASGQSVILKRTDGRTVTDLTAVADIAAKERPVPARYLDGINGPTQDFVDEFIYLIGGPAAIPHYSRGRFKRVPVPQRIKANPYVARRKGRN